MPHVYRVMNEHPKTVYGWGAIEGTEKTILPERTESEPWPLGSFCAAQMDDALTAKQIKLALTRFRPPPSTGTPFLYRLTVVEENMVRLNPLPEQCFVGNGVASEDSVEVIVTGPVLVGNVEVSVGTKWLPVANFK